uniref:Ig-like domain-containing protein n=1 Tax=Neogobius melanostomus TaxID=47308 RepID=A0A8C6S3W6_9GOBI
INRPAVLLMISVVGTYISACSDSEKEDLYGLDGEETFHFDFEKNKEVYTLPKFGDHFECLSCYELALDNEAVCKSHLQSSVNTWTFLCHPPGAPLLYPRDPLLPSKPNILVCQASGFYPAPVNFTWTRDRLTINSSSVSQAFPQSDGTFTQFSTIELLQPEEGQEYICSLEHPALKEPATRLLIRTISITNTNNPPRSQ